MTHIENISHILEYGLTHRLSKNANPDYIAIGDKNIIEKRAGRILPNKNKLGDYIPFYFGARMPMLYVIQKGFNSVPTVEPEKIIYCITSVEKVLSFHLDFLFSNGHLNSALSEIFGIKDINRIDKVLDFKAINAKFWKDDNDTDLKRRKEAEFLIQGDIPVQAIEKYIAYNETAEKALVKYGVHKNAISVSKNDYF